jgi:molybdopterin-guanine dinucleotide biosynthesis protein A
VINAGGQSRRMGQSKALLPVPPYSQPLLQHVVQRLQKLPIEQVIVIANDPSLASMVTIPLPALFLPDAYPDCGPLGGIATGLRSCLGWGIFLACDMPLVNPLVFQALSSLVDEQASHGNDSWDAIVPVVAGFEQTLHALYHPRVLPAIEHRLASGQLRTTSFLADVRTRWVHEDELRPVDPALRSFFNANTPEEWAEACSLLEMGSDK